MHNSVYTDGIKKTEDVLHITTKARNIVKALRYKSSDFNKISKETLTLLEEMSLISDCDPYFDEDDENYMESDEDSVDESGDEYSTDQSKGLKSLKLDVVTRWYSILSMLESLKSRGRHAINIVLQK